MMQSANLSYRFDVILTVREATGSCPWTLNCAVEVAARLAYRRTSENCIHTTQLSVEQNLSNELITSIAEIWQNSEERMIIKIIRTNCLS
jgi:hypothetical protein